MILLVSYDVSDLLSYSLLSPCSQPPASISPTVILLSISLFAKNDHIPNISNSYNLE